MSNFGHYTQQYYGNKIKFPNESFLVAGISYYQDNCKNINYSSELLMKCEPENEYDNGAICILYDENKIGYVPKCMQMLCQENINKKLKVINIKNINNIVGVRVVLECHYTGNIDTLF